MESKPMFKEQLYIASIGLEDWDKIFEKPEYHAMIIQCIRGFQFEYNIRLYAYSMIKDEVHFMVVTKEEEQIIQVLQHMKAYVYHKVNEKKSQRVLESKLKYNYLPVMTNLDNLYD